MHHHHHHQHLLQEHSHDIINIEREIDAHVLLQHDVHCYLSTTYLLTPPHSFAVNLAHTCPSKEES